MGAEGNIVIMPRWRWNEHTDRDPAEFGLYVGRICGVDAVWDYFGEPWYELRIETITREDHAERELVEWFRETAEHHEVWT